MVLQYRQRLASRVVFDRLTSGASPDGDLRGFIGLVIVDGETHHLLAIAETSLKGWTVWYDTSDPVGLL